MKMNSFLLLLFVCLCVSASAHKWEKFHGLAGCRQGDTNPAIPELKKYLHHFGYLPNEHHDHSKFTESFDEALHSALRTYQLNFNLKATGVLDPPTIGMLVTPRCGVPDIINGTTRMLSGKLFGGRIHFDFPQPPQKWPPAKRDLKYIVDYATYTRTNIPMNSMRLVISSAFARWAAVTGFTFQEVNALPAEITIGFYRRSHGDPKPFDGQGGALAHAFYPPYGKFHLDADEDWQVHSSQWGPNSIDLQSVCVHEIGHLLGLAHSTVQGAVMFPSLDAKTLRRDLAKDDIDGIKALYGFPLSAKGAGDANLHVAY